MLAAMQLKPGRPSKQEILVADEDLPSPTLSDIGISYDQAANLPLETQSAPAAPGHVTAGDGGGKAGDAETGEAGRNRQICQYNPARSCGLDECERALCPQRPQGA